MEETVHIQTVHAKKGIGYYIFSCTCYCEFDDVFTRVTVKRCVLVIRT